MTKEKETSPWRRKGRLRHDEEEGSPAMTKKKRPPMTKRKEGSQ